MISTPFYFGDVVLQVSPRWMGISISEFQEVVLHALKVCKLIRLDSRVRFSTSNSCAKIMICDLGA